MRAHPASPRRPNAVSFVHPMVVSAQMPGHPMVVSAQTSGHLMVVAAQMSGLSSWQVFGRPCYPASLE